MCQTTDSERLAAGAGLWRLGTTEWLGGEEERGCEGGEGSGEGTQIGLIAAGGTGFRVEINKWGGTALRWLTSRTSSYIIHIRLLCQ